jgi:transcriptional/translational regulatory protein YebC/TACO1
VLDLEELELEVIDYGVDEIEEDEGEIILYGQYSSYSTIQKYLEENGFEIHSAEFERFPQDVKELTEEQRTAVTKLIDKIDEDEDVVNVFHNMKEED